MRVIVAEDSALLRGGLVRLLEDEGHEVTHAVGDADALLSVAADGPVDVVVTDVRMPPGHAEDGLRAALAIRARRPDVGVLVLSQYVERRYAAELLASDAGRVGYLLKDRVADVGEFLDALERVAAGGSAFDPEVVRRLLARTRRDGPLERLTTRERDVLELMAQGLTNTRLATALHLSVSSVEKHVAAIFDKLGLRAEDGISRRVAAVVAYLGG